MPSQIPETLSALRQPFSRRHFLAAAAAGAVTPAWSRAHASWQGERDQQPSSPAGNAQLAARTRGLMPVPSHVQWRTGVMPLTVGFNVAATGAARQDDRIEAALSRLLMRIARRTALNLDPWLRGNPATAGLRVNCQAAGPHFPTLGEDESYRLEISPEQARLEAPGIAGALRGLETLYQLVEAQPPGYGFPAVVIEDRPRFAWRGLLLDVSRHFQSVAEVERTLELMASCKFNVLHWHLSDDQGFRVESRVFPRLQELGSDGQFYTQNEIRGVIERARQLGIRILPEFDMPAHTQAWMPGYPRLGSAPGPNHIARRFGYHNAVFDPTRSYVYRFLDRFFAEMAGLFPDAFLHIGGDENKGPEWRENPNIRAFMRRHGITSKAGLQTYFNRRLNPIVRHHGKIMAGWEEILNPKLPKDVVVEAWLSVGALASIVRHGNRGILSAGYYLDLMWPAAEHYAVDPIPPDSPLSPEEKARVLGGEACMWGEFVPPPILDSHIWPRAAAIAERLWSPAGVNDVPDMYRRLNLTSLELEALGSTHRALPGILLRGFARGQNPAPLLTLLDVIEPMKGYGQSQHTYNVFTPPAFMVYAAPPESAARQWLPPLVQSFLGRPRGAAGKAAGRRLLQLFAAWERGYEGYKKLLPHCPQMAELEPLYLALTGLGAAGGAAVRSLLGQQPLPAGWAAQKLTALAASKPKYGDVIIIIGPQMKLLLDAADAGNPSGAAPVSGV